MDDHQFESAMQMIDGRDAEIERLTAEVKQCALELGEAAKLLQNSYPRTAGIFEEACGRARIAIGLTPCDVEQKADGENNG
jgi:hypothetical protein